MTLNSTAAVQSAPNGRGHSQRVWHDCPLDRLRHDAGLGLYIFEDFHQFHGAVDTNVGLYQGRSGAFYSFEDTNCAIAQDAAYREGVVKLTSVATDNKEAWLQAGGPTSVMAKLLDADSLLDKLWFEVRVMLSSITNDHFGALCGLGAPGLAVENTLTDAGALVDKDYLGFFRPEGDGDGVDLVYREEGSAMVTAVADLPIALDTWTNLAFKTEPKNSDGARLTVFQDNVQASDYVDLRTIPADFPAAKLLSFLAGLKTATGTAFTFKIDYFALAMQFKN